MTDREIQQSLATRSVVALTMWGEARGDWREGNSSVEERIAVGCVIRNRLSAWKRFNAVEDTYKAICLAPKQFSCWIPEGGVENYTAVMAFARKIAEGLPWSNDVLKECLFLADGIVSGQLLDRTSGATMYYAPRAMVPKGRVPSWATNKATSQIGDQLFLVG